MESNTTTAITTRSGTNPPPIPKNPKATKDSKLVTGEFVKNPAIMDTAKALEALYGLREKTASERDSIVTNSNTEQIQELDNTIAWMEAGAHPTQETMEALT